MGEAPGSQCVSTRERAGDHQALRSTRSIRRVPQLASSSVNHQGHCAGVPLALIAHERWQMQRRMLWEAPSPSVRVQGIVPRMLAMMSVPPFSRGMRNEMYIPGEVALDHPLLTLLF